MGYEGQCPPNSRGSLSSSQAGSLVDPFLAMAGENVPFADESSATGLCYLSMNNLPCFLLSLEGSDGLILEGLALKQAVARPVFGATGNGGIRFNVSSNILSH